MHVKPVTLPLQVLPYWTKASLHNLAAVVCWRHAASLSPTSIHVTQSPEGDPNTDRELSSAFSCLRTPERVVPLEVCFWLLFLHLHCICAMTQASARKPLCTVILNFPRTYRCCFWWVQVSVMLLGAPWLSSSCIKYASIKEAGKITFDMDATCDAYIKTILNIMSPGARQAMLTQSAPSSLMAPVDMGGVQGWSEQLL